MGDASANAETPTRRAGWLGLIAAPALVLGLGTLVFAASDLDLGVSEVFHRTGHGWEWKDFPIFALLYDHGTLPAIALTAVACVVLLAGLVSRSARRWRKIAAYFVLVVVIAPGLLVNTVFKEHWGRPRPRDVVEFGGRHQFERVWEYDAASPGKSFPSGHASMGFTLFALYFIGRALRVSWALPAALAALLLGSMLGLARVAQGGHFASDVLWSAGFCYFTALLLARLMRLEAHPFYEGGKTSKATWAVLGLSAAGAGAFAVAIPYQDEKLYQADAQSGARTQIDIELDRAHLLVSGGDEFRFTAHAEAFGSFGSELLDRFSDDLIDGGVQRIQLRQAVKGWFANLEQPASLSVPKGKGGEIEVSVSEGSITVELFAGDWAWKIDAGDGDLVLRIPEGLDLKVTRASVRGVIDNSVDGLEWSPQKGRWKRGETPTVKVRVSVGGSLRFESLQR